jgi:alpha-L-arabinofuranosidase
MEGSHFTGTGDSRPLLCAASRTAKAIRWRRAAVLVGSAALACLTAGPASAQETTITVDASTEQRSISPLLFGVNHRYGFDGFQSFDPAARRVYPRLAEEVGRAGISWIRYPGGTMANLFRWQRAVGPPALRGCQINGGNRGNGGPLSSDYGPDEHQRFVEEVGGTSSVVVNFATGSPEEAAAWVEYMNAPVGTSRWADLRARNGHPEPYGVKWWEVGNELEIATQEYWMGPGNALPGVSPLNAHKYAFGGSTPFFRQQVGTECDRGPEASFSDGRPGQAKFADYPPVAAGQVVEVARSAWQEVDDLASAGPTDRVYTLNRATGQIQFGDGVHGAIPPEDAEITISYTSGPHAGFVDFYRAMKVADPSINVCPSYEDPAFLKAMGAEHPYDCIVSHPYTVYPSMPTETAHDFAMFEADARAADVEEVQQSARRESGRDVPAAVTEYGILPAAALAGQEHADSDYLRSLDHALYTASQLIHWADLEIPIAGRHTLVDFDAPRPEDGVPSPVGFSVFGFFPSFTPSATAQVFELFSHMTGTRQVGAAVSGNPTRAGPTGAYPALLALASTDRRGRLSLIVINRDPMRDIATTVALERFPEGGQMEAWTLNGPSTTSFNTPEQPNVVTLAKTRQAGHSTPLAWTFPAHSVTALRFGGARRGCLPKRRRAGSRGIGRIRLGQRRAQVVRRNGEPARRTRSTFRYCVAGGGRVTVVFSQRGRARLVVTTAPGHRARGGIHVRSSKRRVRRVYPRSYRLSRGVLGTSRSSRVVLGLRRSRVRYVGVADRRLIKKTRLLRSTLRRAGLARQRNGRSATRTTARTPAAARTVTAPDASISQSTVTGP